MTFFDKNKFLKILETQIDSICFKETVSSIISDDKQNFILTLNRYLPYMKILLKLLIFQYFQKYFKESQCLNLDQEKSELMNQMKFIKNSLIVNGYLGDHKINNIIEIVVTIKTKYILKKIQFFSQKNLCEKEIFVCLSRILYGKNISLKCYQILRKQFNKKKTQITLQKKESIILLTSFFFPQLKEKKKQQKHNSFTQSFVKKFIQSPKNPEQTLKKYYSEDKNYSHKIMNQKIYEIIDKVKQIKHKSMSNKVKESSNFFENNTEREDLMIQKVKKRKVKISGRKNILLNRVSVRAWRNSSSKKQIRKAVGEYRFEEICEKKNRVKSICVIKNSEVKEIPNEFRKRQIKIPIFRNKEKGIPVNRNKLHL